MEIFPLKLTSFGLEIAKDSIRVIQVEKKKNQLKVISFGKKEIKEGIVGEESIQDEREVAKAILETLKNVKGKAIKTKYVALSLPEEKVFLEIIKMPKMKEEELKSAISYELENHIPLPLNEVYFDFQIIPPIFDSQNQYKILTICALKKTVDSYIRTVKLANLIPVAIESESLAIARAILEKNSSLPLIIARIGTTKTNFILVENYFIKYSFTCPISSMVFDEAVMKALNVDFEKAKELRMKKGVGQKMKIYFKNGQILQKIEETPTFEALIPPLVDFSQQLQKIISYYQSYTFDGKSEYNLRKVEKIILCGEGAILNGIEDFLSLKLKIPVEVSTFWEKYFEQHIFESSNANFQEFIIPLGLALKQFYD
jgi:type IV pilus assembly protein PilM